MIRRGTRVRRISGDYSLEWYRDRIQAQYGRPINEWEKETGRRLAADFYKRKLPSRSAQAVPLASTKTDGFGGEIPVIQPVAKHDDSCCGGTGGSCGCSH